MWKSIFKIGGTVMSALINIGSLALDVKGVAAPHNIAWQWIAIGAFIVFAFIVLFSWHAQYRKTQECEDKRPIIKIVPKLEGKFARFNVQNMGHHTASFSIRISNWRGIEAITPIQSDYEGKWRYTNGEKDCILKSTESRDVDIIENEGQTLNEQGKENKELRKLKIWGCFEHWYSRVQIGTEVRFTTQIFADPKLKSDFEQTYMLTVGNENFAKFKEI